MNVQTISMDKNVARKKFLEYRHAVKARHDKEDEQIMKGYRQLSLGRQLINVREAIINAGFDSLLRPNLAIMRADKSWCWYRTWGSGELQFSPEEWPRSNKINSGTYNYAGGPKHSRDLVKAKALVPIIPPELRPRTKLSNYHILWEADWEKVPVDPMLLKHIGGDLFAVLAVWDLTEIERLVLSGRL